MSRALIVGLALLAAACETVPTSAVSPGGGPTIPSGSLALGDWRTATADATLRAFQANVTARYGAGLALSAAMADMREQEFSCAPPSRGDGRGDPPAQVCRRTETASGCTHTWQVHFFDQNNDARLARTRGLYDRRCGNEGLLGGPG